MFHVERLPVTPPSTCLDSRADETAEPAIGEVSRDFPKSHVVLAPCLDGAQLC
jgi:hypothetical protein